MGPGLCECAVGRRRGQDSLDVFVQPQIWVQLVQAGQAVEETRKGVSSLLLGVRRPGLHFL
jgi:hypothetical protein